MNSDDQQRFVASSNDLGSGASVGLATGLVTTNTYNFSLRHASDGSATVTTTDAYLVGFFMDYTEPEAPVPELPTFILLGVGLAALAGYLILRRRNMACRRA